MKKNHTPLTGRVFFCLGIEDNSEECLNYAFEIGRQFLETKHDIDEVNLCDDDELLLIGKNWFPLYVKRSDFALMPEETEKLSNSINKVNEI